MRQTLRENFMATLHIIQTGAVPSVNVAWEDEELINERTLRIKVWGGDLYLQMSPEEAAELQAAIGRTLNDLNTYRPYRPAIGAGTITDRCFAMARFIMAAADPTAVSNGDLVAAGFPGWRVREEADIARRLASCAMSNPAPAGAPIRIDGSTHIAAFSGHESRDVDLRRQPEWTSTIDDFRAANPDMTADEVGFIVTALETEGEYRAGGGAEAEFTIRLAPAADTDAKAA
jgi:hypothetical protein